MLTLAPGPHPDRWAYPAGHPLSESERGKGERAKANGAARPLGRQRTDWEGGCGLVSKRNPLMAPP